MIKGSHCTNEQKKKMSLSKIGNKNGKGNIGKKRPGQSLVMKMLWKQGKIIPQTSEQMKARTKNLWKRHPHPKGMLGKHQSIKSKIITGITSRAMWKDKNHRINSEEYRKIRSDRAIRNNLAGYSKYSTGKMGTYNVNGKNIFFRSLWEPNYALYLDFLIKQKQIKSWEYEKDTFWFEKIKRGTRSYKPDFKIFNNDNSIEYHEVKGWMDQKSKIKLKRMKKYHPNIKIVLIDSEYYNDLKKKLGKLLNFYS